MKRSEMVEHIAEEFLKLYGGQEDEWEKRRESTKMSRLKFAHQALKAAEGKGMFPPFADIIEGTGGCCFWEHE